MDNMPVTDVDIATQNDLISQLRHIFMAPNDDDMQALADDAADLLEWQQHHIQKLSTERDRWQATAAGLSQDISNAEDDIEKLRTVAGKAQQFIVHHTNCGFLISRYSNCTCGFDDLWKELEHWS